MSNQTNENKLGVVIRDVIGVGVSGIFAGIFFSSDHFIYGLWSSFIGLSALLHVLVYFIAKNYPSKAKLVWSVYVCALLAVFIWFFIWSYRVIHRPSEPAFSFVPMEKYVELKNPRYLLSWLYGSPDNRILSPINIEMYADFTNLKDTPLTIKSYQFEGQTPNGEWEILPTIDIKDGRLDFLSNTNFDLKQMVFLVDCGSNVFPSILDDREIRAGETITGSVFLEAPTNWFGGSIRLRIRDGTDTDYVEEIKPTREMTNYLNAVIQNEGRSLSRETEDISKCPIIRYSHFFNPNH